MLFACFKLLIYLLIGLLLVGIEFYIYGFNLKLAFAIFLVITFFLQPLNNKVGDYADRLWKSFDILVCTIMHNTEYVTISGYTHYLRIKKQLTNKSHVEKLIDLLFFWQVNHCQEMFEIEYKKGFYGEFEA